MKARPFNLQGWVKQDAAFVGWQYLVNIENANIVEVRNGTSEHQVDDFHEVNFFYHIDETYLKIMQYLKTSPVPYSKKLNTKFVYSGPLSKHKKRNTGNQNCS